MTELYNFDWKIQSGPYEIGIDMEEDYGYFEHASAGIGGGLWFERGHLVDWDGLEYLPKLVITGLCEVGIVVDEEFE